jgi:tetratricopeptide (TPR) repeat protein
MWDLAVREEDFGAADSMLQRYHGVAPLSMRLLTAQAGADSATLLRLFEEARAADNRQPQIAARFVATYRGDLDAAERLDRLGLAAQRRPLLRSGAQQLLAWLEVARGRWSAAKAAFADAEGMEGVVPPLGVSRAVAATLPFMAVHSADLTEVRGEIERWNPAAEETRVAAGLVQALAPHLRQYLLGLLSSASGDAAGASQAAAELERLPAPPGARDVPRALANAVRADVEWRRGRPAEALADLERGQGALPLELVEVPFFATLREYALDAGRFLRADLLYRLGRDAEALRWLQTSLQGAPNEFVYLAPSHLLQGKIYERIGDRVKAGEHYRRFITLWKDCDPELRVRLEEARARLAALGSGAASR